MRRRLSALTFALTLGSWQTPVAAAEGEPVAAPEREPDAAAEQEAEKRPVPNYDGRPSHTTPGEQALWVPRILLSPFYFVSEFVIRRPLGFAITAAEKAELPAALYDFFAFGPDHSIGIVPLFAFDFGFRPSVGLYAFWDDFGAKGNDLRLNAATGGRHWFTGTATDRFRFSPSYDLTLSTTVTVRPDYAFHGIGWDTTEDDLRRYSSERVDARIISHLAFGYSLFDVSLGYRGVSFGDTEYERDSVHDAVVGGAIAAPAGFYDGYQAPVLGARLVLDSRSPSRKSATGVRFDVGAEQGIDLGNSPTSAWVRYGATLGGLLDLADSGRVVSLSVSTSFADPVGERPVPFTELVQPAGPGLLPGFRDGRLFDRSAAVVSLRYAWPIWIWLNGTLQVATGNVFGTHLQDLKLERSRLSMAMGFEANASRDVIFQALLGLGTEPFESGTNLESVRLVFGARHGF